MLAAGAVAALAACHDTTAFGARALTLGASHRLVSMNEDTLSVVDDSVVVTILGEGAASGAWTATHRSASWITLLTASGTGSGRVRWRRDPTGLATGTYVDTITVSVASAVGSPARIVDSLTIEAAQAAFIAVKRAWQPGERDARIASVIANREWVFPYVGDVSDLAPAVYADVDSVVVVVANPLVAARVARSAFQLAPRFNAGWSISGLDIRRIDTTQVPADTSDLLGVFWSNPAEQTQKGIVLADRCTGLAGAAKATCRTSRTVTTPGGANIAVNTTSFEAALQKSGAGGGERRFSTSEYWEANAGNFRVTAAAYGGNSTIGSGPFTGGTQANGTMQGRMQTINMPRLLPTVDGSFITVDFDFRVTSIGSLRMTCLFSSPCTGQAGAAAVRRRGAAAFRQAAGVRR